MSQLSSQQNQNGNAFHAPEAAVAELAGAVAESNANGNAGANAGATANANGTTAAGAAPFAGLF